MSFGPRCVLCSLCFVACTATLERARSGFSRDFLRCRSELGCGLRVGELRDDDERVVVMVMEKTTVMLMG
eukprot:104955-Rhodomonas_salina.3